MCPVLKLAEQSAPFPVTDERGGDGNEGKNLREDSGGADDGVIDDPERGIAEAEGK